MRVQGINIAEGYLVLPVYRAVPDAFWSRLQHLIDKAGLRYEYKADRLASREGEGTCWEREERLFARWTRRVAGEPSLWPWSRGWTQVTADTYLDPIAAQAGAQASEEASNDRGRAATEASGGDPADPGAARDRAVAPAGRGPRSAAAVLGALRGGGER